MTTIVDGLDEGPAGIVRLAAAGDSVAFDRLVVVHSPDMARVAYLICADMPLAQEATQVAWSIAWRKLGTLRDPDRLRPWLLAIVANEARRVGRSRRDRTVREIALDGIDLESPADPAARTAAIDLRTALAKLKPEDRALLALRYVAGLNSTELARASGLSAPGVRARLARLLRHLREELEDG